MTRTAELREKFRAYPAFMVRDARIFFGKRVGRGYVQLMLRNLEKKGEITRIAKGVYSFNQDAQLAGFAFRPFYYGLEDALSLQNLWEQETNPIIITPRRVRPGLREFGGRNFLVKRISRKMFFGFQFVKYFEWWIPVSTPEKILIDFAYYRKPLLPQALEEISKKIDFGKLEQFLKKSPQRVRKKVGEMLGA